MKTTDTSPNGPPSQLRIGNALRAAVPQDLGADPLYWKRPAAALHWAVVDAPGIALRAINCALPLLDNSIEPLAPLKLAPVTAERASRPGTFRSHTSQLRAATTTVDTLRIPMFNALPGHERSRVYGSQHPNETNRVLLSTLIDDLVFTRAWLATHGVKAGYWSYRFLCTALEFVAMCSNEHRQQLATHLISSAESAAARIALDEEDIALSIRWTFDGALQFAGALPIEDVPSVLEDLAGSLRTVPPVKLIISDN